jgi:hypothetical protein
MQQAYRNLNYVTTGVAVTHKYVRFKPGNCRQYSTLIDLDIDLSDYPLDYEVIEEGDYYNDGVTPAESIPWLYAVVPASFTPPSGITYEVLQQIHVPALGSIENEAFRITGNPSDNNSCSSSATTVADGDTLTNTINGGAVPNSEPPGGCPPGTHFSGGSCVPDAVQPPSPAPALTPSGTITVYDLARNESRPLRNALVVAKRFFKIEHTSTNNQGQFSLNKEFNKVKILVSMTSAQGIIRALRRARLWQMLRPVEINFGKFRGTLNDQFFTIDYNGDARSVGARSWAAATAHNNLQEYRDYATQQGIGAQPNMLKVLMTNWKRQSNTGAAPLYCIRSITSIPNPFLSYYFIGDAAAVNGGFGVLAVVLAADIDISMGYNDGNNGTIGSSAISETMFHECTHAAHFVKWGLTQYANFVNAEVSEISGANPPYGNKTSVNSPRIALGESWAYHMGHYLANLKYGGDASKPQEQGFVYGNGDIYNLYGSRVAIGTGLPQHLNLLEDFNSQRTGTDPFAWIPQGLYYDLIDNRNDLTVTPARVGVNDNVSGYTNQQFFNALDADISTLQSYRARLLSEARRQALLKFFHFMVTKRPYLILLPLLVGFASLQFQCNKRLGCEKNVYGFSMGIKAYPDKDSVKVGDTIWFEINEPTTLEDGISRNMIDYSGAANLGSVMNFHHLSPDNEFTEPSAEKFRIILSKGRQVSSRDSTFERQYLFREENQLYLFKIGVIPKDSGTFRVFFTDAANVYRNQDECTKATFSILFEHTNQHYYLSPTYNGDTTIRGGDYYFKVY